MNPNKKRKMRESFNLHNPEYNRTQIVFSFPFLREKLRRFNFCRGDIVFGLLPNKGTKLLDVGCGSGLLIFEARERFSEVYGIDVRACAIETMKKTAKLKFPGYKNIHTSVCDVNKGINFEDGMFDVVTAIAVIEHLIDPYFVIREISRILKKDGIFIMEVPNIAYIKHRIRLLFGLLPETSRHTSKSWDGGHLHYFTKKTLVKLLNDCGFKILNVTGSGLFANFRNFWPSFLTGDLCIKAKKIK